MAGHRTHKTCAEVPDRQGGELCPECEGAALPLPRGRARPHDEQRSRKRHPSVHHREEELALQRQPEGRKSKRRHLQPYRDKQGERS